MNSARIGDDCPIAGCRGKVRFYHGASVVCDRPAKHHLVNLDKPKPGGIQDPNLTPGKAAGA